MAARSFFGGLRRIGRHDLADPARRAVTDSVGVEHGHNDAIARRAIRGGLCKEGSALGIFGSSACSRCHRALGGGSRSTH